MSKTFILSMLFGGLVCLFGCNNEDSSPATEAKLKEQFSKKNFDINDVPANERQRVQGFIDRNKQLAAAGSNPSAGR